MTCPLCLGKGISPFHQDTYFRCQDCHLVFLDPAHHLSLEEQKKRYDFHENSPDNEGYVRFLSRLASPMLERLAPASEGLDFGCGPGPTLSVILEQAGHRVANFDPIYFPDRDLLTHTYSFVTCTEVLEHLGNPRQELEWIDGILAPGGWFGSMTEILGPEIDFATWHYARDETHVCFFAPETMDWIARWRSWKKENPAPNIYLFRKAI